MLRSEVPTALSLLIEDAYRAHDHHASAKWTFTTESVARQVISDFNGFKQLIQRAEPSIELTYCRRTHVLLVHVEDHQDAHD